MPKEVKPRQKEVPKVDDALYGITTLAAKLGIPVSKVYTMCAAGEILGYRLGIRWMFKQAEVDKWLATRRVGPQL